jgi:oligoribonuclease (3'-5' exoribonuclease)
LTPPRLILTALATSGLKAIDSQPLELGLLAVDRKTFELVDLLTIPLHADPSSVLETADKFVVDMHTKNGLFEEMAERLPAPHKDFDAAAKTATLQAIDFIDANGATGECRSPLIGFNTYWLTRWLSTRFTGLVSQFRSELDLTAALDVFGIPRPEKGDGRAETTLTEAYAALCGLRRMT